MLNICREIFTSLCTFCYIAKAIATIASENTIEVIHNYTTKRL